MDAAGNVKGVAGLVMTGQILYRSNRMDDCVSAYEVNSQLSSYTESHG